MFEAFATLLAIAWVYNPNSNRSIASQLARALDLTSLHELARTCRQVRANLLRFRQSLIGQSLRCDNEQASPAALLGDALSRSFEAWTMYGLEGRKVDRLTSGKVGACARDMVGECKKCNRMVCRVSMGLGPRRSLHRSNAQSRIAC